jgi:hypothetical protein
MPIVNGSMHVKNILTAGNLLFREIISSSDMTRGANVNLVNGRFYYKVDNDNTFEFLTRTDVQELIDAIDTGGGGGTGGDTIINTTLLTESQPLGNIMDLLNTTFFSINDRGVSQLLNINFDASNISISASFTLDKIISSVYKNGSIRRLEY